MPDSHASARIGEKTTYTIALYTLDDLAANKTQLLMFMIVTLMSGAIAVLMAIAYGSRDFLTISIPGFVIGAFFAFKYFTFDRSKAREEEHRKSRRNRHH